MAQDERNEQAADAPVAIQKRMDSLELDVRQSGFDQRWIGRVFVVNEAFQRAHAILNVGGWRWNEMRVSGPRAANPVLRATEFARRLLAPSASREQFGMHFPDETIGKREAS